jgi:hypothetical protein
MTSSEKNQIYIWIGVHRISEGVALSPETNQPILIDANVTATKTVKNWVPSIAQKQFGVDVGTDLQ